MSRRNLTDEKRTYLIGKQYEHRKNRVGGVGSNQYKKVEGAQSEPLAPNAKTYDIIARENNVSRETVKRAEQYAKSVDNIAKTLGNETKEKILSGELKTAQNATECDNFTKRYKHLNHVAKTSP